MKLVLAIVRKDFWRLRWMLAVWLAVAALRLGVGFSIIFGVGTDGQALARWLQDIANGLMVLGLVFTWMLTALLVQEDLLVGSTQFWVTRPISGARLLGAKVAGWLLLLWLPAVVLTLPWWLTCGFGPWEIALAALELLLWQAAASLPAVLVAVVTNNLSRFVVWSFAAIFAAALLPGVLMKLSDDRIIYNFSDSPSLAVIYWTTAGFFTAWVVVRQYLRRDMPQPRAIGWAVGGLLLALMVGRVVGGLQGWARYAGAQWSDWHAERASGVSLVLQDYYFEGGKKSLDVVRLHSVLELRGLPDDLALDTGDGGKQTWRWPGLPDVTRGVSHAARWWANIGDDERGVRSALGRIARPKPDEETVRYEAQRRAERFAKAPQIFRRAKQVAVGVEISEELLGPTFTRIKQTPPAYEASVRLRLMRPELWAEVPLQAGGWHSHAAHGFRVGALSKIDPDGPADAKHYPNRTCYAPFVATLAEFFWDTQPMRSWSAFDWNSAGLFIVNRVGGDMWRQHVRSGPALTISSVSIQRSTMQVWQPTMRRGDAWVPRDPNWLAGTTVAMVGFREEARFTAVVKAERYEPAK